MCSIWLGQMAYFPIAVSSLIPCLDWIYHDTSKLIDYQFNLSLLMTKISFLSSLI